VDKSWIVAAAALIALPALPAQAQKADRDFDGHLYCNADGVDLRETGDGGYKVDIGVSNLGDADHAVYPAGGKKLFGPEGELRSYVSVNYEFFLGADGNPTGRPAPVRLGASTGRFTGPRLEPFSSLELRLAAGDTLSPSFVLNESFYNIALVAGDFGTTGSDNPYDGEMTPEALGALVSAFEQSSQRWLILSQDGDEVARIPVPSINLVPVREKAVAWIRKTVPLIKQGKCA
jgi:hypothetical protein